MPNTLNKSPLINTYYTLLRPNRKPRRRHRHSTLGSKTTAPEPDSGEIRPEMNAMARTRSGHTQKNLVKSVY